MKKKIVFLTGTRADYGKIKSAVLQLQKYKDFDISLCVTGMHNLKEYGSTYFEIFKDKIKNIHRFSNQNKNDNMETILSKTILAFKKFVRSNKPDLIIVHGDRVEPLAGALVGIMNNIKVAHIEGGEISGTIDEVLRHSISKLCNIHFTTNDIAKKRLIQMGELSSSIYTIGSPDVDIILKKDLPTLSEVQKRYNFHFNHYGVVVFHSTTNDLGNLEKETKILLDSIVKSKKNFIIIYPNNDPGTNIIIKQYKKVKSKNIKIYPSLRFEHYLSLLKYSNFILGNSSSGIMEAPYYGIPSINIGNRQLNRASMPSIINLPFNKNKILKYINHYSEKKILFKKTNFFGHGNSDKKLIKILLNRKFWNKTNIKQFNEIN